jgi:dimethylargininase
MGRERRVALTRPVPDSLSNCELTHLTRVPIDVALARRQHADYERALAWLGCDIRHISVAHTYPDSVFVEDTAVVIDELAVITRPGAESRRAEVSAVAEALSPFRPLTFISAPATVDGGDVLRINRTLYVGIGARTNAAGVRQLAAIVQPHGYDVREVAVRGCLHLKSAVTELARDCVLLNPQWVSPAQFDGVRAIEVDPDEPSAANVLRIGDTVLCAAAYGRTNARLERAGLAVHTVDLSELAKAEAGVTCCSLIVQHSL